MKKSTEKELLSCIKELTKNVERISYLIDEKFDEIGDRDEIRKKLDSGIASVLNKIENIEKDLGTDKEIPF